VFHVGEHKIGDVYRRGVLQTLSASALAFGSGCVDSPPYPPRYLEAVYLRNDDDTAHEFRLTIEQDGAAIQETTIELDQSQEFGRVDCEWSGSGPFAVTCTLGGGQTETVQIAEIEEGSGEYADVTFIATTFGELSWSGVVDDGGTQRCSGSASG
jgi:hypothetical protein